MKAISIYMGHSNPEFTDEIYTYHEETAYDCSSISEVWEEIRPKQDSELSSDSPSDGFSIPFEGDFMKEFLEWGKQKDRINGKRDHDLQCSICSDKLEMDAKYSKAAKNSIRPKMPFI